MLTILFTTPIFNDLATRVIKAIGSLPDVRLGVISQKSQEMLSPEVRAHIVANWQVDNVLDAGQLVWAAESLAKQLGPVHRLLAINEQIQVPIAEAREHFGVAGARAEVAKNFRDKSRMKDLLRAAGLPCAWPVTEDIKIPDHWPLARDKACFAGDGVAIVVAETRALAKDAADKVLVFACNWCSYAGADQAGIEKLQYPPSARIIRTMCSARVSEKFVERAFERGAGAVLLTGCRLTDDGSDCHYINANEQTKKRFEFLRRKFGRKGVAEDRLQLQWVSAAEGKEFAATIGRMDEVLVKLRAQSEPVKV